MFGTVQRLINRLLPFATPGTPLIQDLLHLAALCTALYYAPQIQSWYQAQRNHTGHQDETQHPVNQQNGNNENNDFEARANQQIPRPAAIEDDDSADDSENDEQAAANQGDDGPLFPDALEPNFGAAGEEEEAGHPAPGPGPAGPRPTGSSSRTVGAKKAKSLARKDQRRAYHEFMRSQGEAQRAREAEDAREREAVVAEERARRAVAEAEVEARRVRDREEKKEREARAQREEIARRERAIALVRLRVRERGMCDVAAVAEEIGDADRVWVEKLVKASGLLSEKRVDGTLVMLTESGWVVQVSKQDVETVYAAVLERGGADDQGRIFHQELGGMLEDVLRTRAVSAA